MLHRFSAAWGEEEAPLTVEKLADGRVRLEVAGRSRLYEVVEVARRPGATSFTLLPAGGGALVTVDVEGRAPDLIVTVDNRTTPLGLRSARAGQGRAQERSAAKAKQIVSAMPGKVVKVLVTVGEAIRAGQGVVVVEAMKMENELKAAADGTVESITVKEGQAVEAGQTLATLA